MELRNEYSDVYIPTYLIYGSNDKDELVSVLKEFKNKPEFSVTLIETNSKKNYYEKPQWLGIVEAIKLAKQNKEDVIVLTTPKHRFSKHYSTESFFRLVTKANIKGAELILGGISAFDQAVFLDIGLFWIDSFLGTEFMIIHRSLFNRILNTEFTLDKPVDNRLANLTNYMLLIYPPFSFSSEEYKINGLSCARYLLEATNTRLGLIETISLKYRLNKKKENGIIETLMGTYFKQYPDYVSIVNHLKSTNRNDEK